MRTAGFWEILFYVCLAWTMSGCTDKASKNTEGSFEEKQDIAKEQTRILHLADSIENMLPFINKASSLVFQQHERSFYVNRYTYKGKPLLYVEHITDRNKSFSEKKYFLEKGKLILYSEVTRMQGSEQMLTQKRLFFKNNKMICAESLPMNSNGYSLHNLLKRIRPQRLDQFKDLQALEDAIRQRGKFNLGFERIAAAANVSFLILGRNEIDAFRAVLKINKKDDLIQELRENPIQYAGTRLELNYLITDNQEMIYLSGKEKHD